MYVFLKNMIIFRFDLNFLIHLLYLIMYELNYINAREFLNLLMYLFLINLELYLMTSIFFYDYIYISYIN